MMTPKQKSFIASLGEQVLQLIMFISEDLTSDYYEKVYGTSKFLNIKENKEASDLIVSLNRLRVELSSICEMINKANKGNSIDLKVYKFIEKEIKRDYNYVGEYLLLPGLEVVLEHTKRELQI